MQQQAGAGETSIISQVNAAAVTGVAAIPDVYEFQGDEAVGILEAEYFRFNS